MSSQAKNAAGSRDRRLKKALQENLQKRKAQAKARAGGASRIDEPQLSPREDQETGQDG